MRNGILGDIYSDSGSVDVGRSLNDVGVEK